MSEKRVSPRSDCFVLLAVWLSAVSAAPTARKLYQVYNLRPATDIQLEFLSNLWLSAAKYGLDFWQPPSKLNASVDIMVGPEAVQNFQQKMNSYGLTPKLSIPDVQRLIEERENKLKPSDSAGRILYDASGGPRFNLASYHSYNKISEYLAELQRRYPHWATTFSLGRTHEGRSIQIIKIGKRSVSSNVKGGKPAIWIDAGIHAREWVAPATALYFIHQLVTGYESDPGLRHMVDNLDWYIVPVLNPDGYEYSRSSTEPKIRLWRKNRSPPSCRAAGYFGGRQCCQGVDLNRNFDFHFGEVGSSGDPCEEIFRGTSAFSEPESRAVRDFVMRPGQNFQAFMTLHSYSQIWMYPYGHQRRNYPADVAELKSVALQAKAALQSMYGTQYEVGTGADTLYPAAGGSDDWAKDRAGIKYVYLLELRPEEHIYDGFILNQREILPTAKETWEGVKIVAGTLIKKNDLQPHVGNEVDNEPSESRLTFGGNSVGGGGEFKGKCEDKDPQCHWWASFGGCRVWKDMDKKCPRACNFCDPNAPDADCFDEREDCESWERLRLCSWVKKSCRKTCRFC